MLLQELNEANKEYDAAQNKFSDVKEQRTQMFDNVFMHVSENIDRVYKELTKTSANSVGGTARLDKDKGDDIPPFECGINFSTIPPRKRYREMGQLSGGEKTLAALALLLTINSYKPSPFFVFDEVCDPVLHCAV